MMVWTMWHPNAAVRDVWSVCMSSMCSMGCPKCPDPRPLQIVQHLGDVAPSGNFGLGHRIVVERSQDHRRRPASHANGYVCASPICQVDSLTPAAASQALARTTGAPVPDRRSGPSR